jgi:UDP-N-acetylglucosamine 2-epimerase (non-hydrolysing)
MYEVLNHYLPKIQSSSILSKLKLEIGKYFVVSAHREENISNDKSFFNFLDSLNEIASKYKFPIIVSTHPRTLKRLDYVKNEIVLNPLIQWQKPLGFSDYNSLQMNAYAVLSDSGTISEESSILNFRALNIREAHERPEAMEEAAVMMVGLNSERILQGLEHLSLQKIGKERNFRLVSDYSIPNVSEKIVRIILSYVDYVNRTAWKL